MARLRKGSPPADLRAAVASAFRESADLYYSALGSPPQQGRAEAVEAGGPVEVAGWELAVFVAGLDPAAFYLLGADDTVTLLYPSRADRPDDTPALPAQRKDHA